jgi:hypothetical protein
VRLNPFRKETPEEKEYKEKLKKEKREADARLRYEKEREKIQAKIEEMERRRAVREAVKAGRLAGSVSVAAEYGRMTGVQKTSNELHVEPVPTPSPPPMESMPMGGPIPMPGVPTPSPITLRPKRHSPSIIESAKTVSRNAHENISRDTAAMQRRVVANTAKNIPLPTWIYMMNVPRYSPDFGLRPSLRPYKVNKVTHPEGIKKVLKQKPRKNPLSWLYE